MSLRTYHPGMRLTRPTVALVVASALAVLPAAAQAVEYAPAGKAGANEYVETLPASGGNIAPPANGTSSGSTLTQSSAAKAAQRKLKKLGTNGQAAVQFADATAPTLVPVVPPRHRQSETVVSPSGSALTGFLHVIGGSDAGGIGAFMPLLLAFGLGAAVAFSVVRVRRRSV
jgi:hypothetical protein